MSVPQKRIAWAFAVGLVLVTGAFVLSRHLQAQNGTTLQVASVMEREHITVTDSDNNGIPNWQDALLNNDPIDLSSGTSTEYTPPKTVTGKVAIDFIQNFLNAKRYGPFGDTNEEIVDKATKQLTEASKDTFFVASDIQIVESNDKASLRKYGNQVASILLGAKTGSESELIILQDALRYDTPEKLAELEPISNAYGTMILEMTQIDVPFTYKDEHLNLLNALGAVHEDINAMRSVNEDALYTFMRLKRYQDDVLGLSNTITILFDTLYTTDEVRFAEGDFALQLVRFTQ